MKNYYLVSNTVTTQPAKEDGGVIAVLRIRSSYKKKSK